MSTPPRDSVLRSEQAVEEQHADHLEAEIERDRTLQKQITASSRSASWTGTGPKPVTASPRTFELIGRVALESGVDYVDGEMYIGSWFGEHGGFTVINWTAPAAGLFYRGRDFEDPERVELSEIARSVLGRRTFEHTRGKISDFEHEVADGGHAHDADGFFPSPLTAPSIPRPPQPIPTPPRQQPAAAAEADSADSEVVDTGSTVQPRPKPDEPARVEPPLFDSSPLRAERIVRQAIGRPKSGKLRSVLATLQPDQYDLVTWPRDEPLIISGGPGSGKTVVAMHRAAFLTNLADSRRLAAVRVVGPTREYREHVTDVVRELHGGSVDIVGLDEHLATLAGIDIFKMDQSPDERLGNSWKLLGVIRRGHRSALQTLGRTAITGNQLVDHITQNSAFLDAEVKDEELRDWLAEIRSFENARTQSRCLPLLAAAALQADPTAQSRIDHLIVDEAQDVQPMTWDVLMRPLGSRGQRRVTLLGDINQRRSDWTEPTWEDLAKNLELTDADGSTPVKHLELGYRSTGPILAFANQLIPKGERTARPLQDGPPPIVEKVRASTLTESAGQRAVSLASGHSAGTTAVITTRPREMHDWFRKIWKRSGVLRDSWTDGAVTVTILHPDRARGLEFDAVVVIEPVLFPQNLGRDGVLYTALTRATKELAVVYSQRLPKRLRAPRS